MAYKEGDELFYINGTGHIRHAVALNDERHGALSIKCGIDVIHEVGTLHLCRTMRAAEIVASKRRPATN